MLVDALMRARCIYAEEGGIGLFVDALDEQAAGYYRHFGFAAALHKTIYTPQEVSELLASQESQ